jgi:cell division protease FtsH
MNEGAILAARENRTKISQYDLIRSIEKVMLGPERKSHILNRKEKEITAYHEAGHALVASVLSMPILFIKFLLFLEAEQLVIL